MRADQPVLDVAAGAGNTALATARRFTDVTATDYVPDLSTTAARRSEAEGLPIKTEVADAQNLRYPDGSFDVVFTTFGAMFAPDQERTAGELLLVLKPGGQLGNGQLDADRVHRSDVCCWREARTAAPGLNPALRWGTEDVCSSS